MSGEKKTQFNSVASPSSHQDTLIHGSASCTTICSKETFCSNLRKKSILSSLASSHHLQKTATAVAYVTDGVGLIKVNGQPLKLVEPEVLQYKLWEPVLLLGKDKFAEIDIRVRVRGGGRVAQVYAIRQCIAKAIIAWTQKYVDEATKVHLREILVAYDRTLLVADPRRCEPKKFGGPGKASSNLKILKLILKKVLVPDFRNHTVKLCPFCCNKLSDSLISFFPFFELKLGKTRLKKEKAQNRVINENLDLVFWVFQVLLEGLFWLVANKAPRAPRYPS